MTVAYPPGGGTDLVARALAPYLEKYLGGGAKIVIVNRAGAGGEVGFTALANAPADVTPEVFPHYWRAVGHLAGRYWYEKDPSLSRLNAHLQVFVPRLDPSVQRYVLQGVAQVLFTYLSADNWVLAAELEHFLGLVE